METKYKWEISPMATAFSIMWGLLAILTYFMLADALYATGWGTYSFFFLLAMLFSSLSAAINYSYAVRRIEVSGVM